MGIEKKARCKLRVNGKELDYCKIQYTHNCEYRREPVALWGISEEGTEKLYLLYTCAERGENRAKQKGDDRR